MGAFGSVLGGLLTMSGLFLSIWTTFIITSNYLVFLLFPLFGILGGISLGALNGRKAKTQLKYRNEYISLAAMFFFAIVFLSIYYFVFGLDPVSAQNVTEFGDGLVVALATTSGICTQLGLGLVIANSLAENTGY